MSYIELCCKMQSREVVTLVGPNGNVIATGVINAIEIESGCGTCWNVTLADGRVVFVRTVK